MESIPLTTKTVQTTENLLQTTKEVLYDDLKTKEVKIPILKRQWKEEEEFRGGIELYLNSIIWKDPFSLWSPIQDIKRLSWWEIGVVVKLTLENWENYVFKTAREWVKIQNEEEYYKIVQELWLPSIEVIDSGDREWSYYIVDEFIASERFEKDNTEAMQIAMNKVGKYIAKVHKETMNKYYKDEDEKIKRIDGNRIQNANTYGQKTPEFIENRKEFTDEEKNKMKQIVEELSKATDLCLTHNDLWGTDNLFKVGDTIIPFDPNSNVRHPYADIARFFANNNDHGQRQAFLNWYQEESWDLDEELLEQFIVIWITIKYRRRLEKGKETKETAEMLKEIKDRLNTL